MTDLVIRVGGAALQVDRVIEAEEKRMYAREYIDLVRDGSEEQVVRLRPGMFVYAVNDATKDLPHAELLKRVELLDVLYVREFVHDGATCERLEDGSDDVSALVCACRAYKDIREHTTLHRVAVDDDDLVLGHVPYCVPADAFVAHMPAVIGPGRRVAGARRVSAHSQDTDCESIVPYELTRDAAVDNVRLVELHANSTPLVPHDDVAQFWDPAARQASNDAADKAAAGAFGPKKSTPSKTVISIDDDDSSLDAKPDRPSAKTNPTSPPPPPPPPPETKKRSKPTATNAHKGVRAESDPAPKKKRLAPAAPVVDLADDEWHQHQAALWSRCSKPSRMTSASFARRPRRKRRRAWRASSTTDRLATLSTVSCWPSATRARQRRLCHVSAACWQASRTPCSCDRVSIHASWSSPSLPASSLHRFRIAFWSSRLSCAIKRTSEWGC